MASATRESRRDVAPAPAAASVRYPRIEIAVVNGSVECECSTGADPERTTKVVCTLRQTALGEALSITRLPGDIALHILAQQDIESVHPDESDESQAYTFKLTRPMRWFDGEEVSSLTFSAASKKLYELLQTFSFVNPAATFMPLQPGRVNPAFKYSATQEMKAQLLSSPEYVAATEQLADAVLTIGATVEQRGGQSRLQFRRSFLQAQLTHVNDLLLSAGINVTSPPPPPPPPHHHGSHDGPGGAAAMAGGGGRCMQSGDTAFFRRGSTGVPPSGHRSPPSFNTRGGGGRQGVGVGQGLGSNWQGYGQGQGQGHGQGSGGYARRGPQSHESYYGRGPAEYEGGQGRGGPPSEHGGGTYSHFQGVRSGPGPPRWTPTHAHQLGGGAAPVYFGSGGEGERQTQGYTSSHAGMAGPAQRAGAAASQGSPQQQPVIVLLSQPGGQGSGGVAGYDGVGAPPYPSFHLQGSSSPHHGGGSPSGGHTGGGGPGGGYPTHSAYSRMSPGGHGMPSGGTHAPPHRGMPSHHVQGYMLATPTGGQAASPNDGGSSSPTGQDSGSAFQPQQQSPMYGQSSSGPNGWSFVRYNQQ